MWRYAALKTGAHFQQLRLMGSLVCSHDSYPPTIASNCWRFITNVVFLGKCFSRIVDFTKPVGGSCGRIHDGEFCWPRAVFDPPVECPTMSWRASKCAETLSFSCLKRIANLKIFRFFCSRISSWRPRGRRVPPLLGNKLPSLVVDLAKWLCRATRPVQPSHTDDNSAIRRRLTHRCGGGKPKDYVFPTALEEMCFAC